MKKRIVLSTILILAVFLISQISYTQVKAGDIYFPKIWTNKYVYSRSDDYMVYIYGNGFPPDTRVKIIIYYWIPTVGLDGGPTFFVDSFYVKTCSDGWLCHNGYHRVTISVPNKLGFYKIVVPGFRYPAHSTWFLVRG